MNKYNPEIHKRQSIRLKGYDYSQAAFYFITVCVQEKGLLFGEIEDDVMLLNGVGKMIETEWEKLQVRFSNIELHEHVVMPNHFHGILQIVEADCPKQMGDKADPQSAMEKEKTVGDMVGAFKSLTTAEYINGVNNLNWEPFNRKLWQRNYYEHIIRNENAYNNIAGYIIDNPKHWEKDKFFIGRKK